MSQSQTQLLAILIIIASVYLQQFVVAQIQQMVTPKVVAGSGIGQCPLQGERRAAIDGINNDIMDILQLPEYQCGDGMWYRIAYLNMSDSSQQCPSAWGNYDYDIDTSGVIACGRPFTSEESCSSTIYTTGQQYSKVCGRVIGYQVASPDAFLPGRDINQAYADGVSITYGQPRTHIWSYVGSYTDSLSTCPCTDSNSTKPPEFVGDNYYCESANEEPLEIFAGVFFITDKLWDGQQCDHEGTCCTAKSPPWFSVELPNPTNDDIDSEVRICGDEGTDNEDTPIELLEIYIQK